MTNPEDRDGEQQPSPLAAAGRTLRPQRHDTLSSLLMDVGQLQRERILDGGSAPPFHPARLISLPSPDIVLEALFALNASTEPEATEADVAWRYLDTLKDLFPGRRFAVRLSDGSALNLVYATNSLLPGAKEAIVVSQSVANAYHLQEFGLPPCIHISPTYTPIFDINATGFEVPLVVHSGILGMFSTEYPPYSGDVESDKSLIEKFAHQLANDLLKTRLLRESLYLKDYLAKLLEHANAPIVVIGKRREIRVVNRAFVTLCGRTREELVNAEFSTIFSESEQTRLLPVFINALRGVPTTGFELKLIKKSGEAARISLNVASVLSPNGDVEGLICIGRDLTELRQLEEQMIHAEKLATLGQLAAGVVHELNNPLTSISVYSEFLLKKALTENGDPKDIDRLRRITQSADRILRFSRDLVTYARPSTAEPSSVPLHESLDQAVVFCEHVLIEHGVHVERHYTESSPLIFAIPSQVHQVFINLITNACHAMPEDEGTLVIETCLTYDGNVCIRIKDNGSGIPEDILPNIFEPFFTTKTEGKGTGLGLSIVRNIVEQHNGSITAHVPPQGGAVFEITLPVRERQSDFAL
ncbi:MAG: PAS domain S-box protein [Myxococcales bacterium]|nr:PAS domain S-box protein [Myxococcales bacterium]MCB9707173.1 PAS domain S-box protein [Myxococcales bacterium]